MGKTPPLEGNPLEHLPTFYKLFKFEDINLIVIIIVVNTINLVDLH